MKSEEPGRPEPKALGHGAVIHITDVGNLDSRKTGQARDVWQTAAVRADNRGADGVIGTVFLVGGGSSCS